MTTSANHRLDRGATNHAQANRRPATSLNEISHAVTRWLEGETAPLARLDIVGQAAENHTPHEPLPTPDETPNEHFARLVETSKNQTEERGLDALDLAYLSTLQARPAHQWTPLDIEHLSDLAAQLPSPMRRDPATAQGLRLIEPLAQQWTEHATAEWHDKARTVAAAYKQPRTLPAEIQRAAESAALAITTTEYSDDPRAAIDTANEAVHRGITAHRDRIASTAQALAAKLDATRAQAMAAQIRASAR